MSAVKVCGARYEDSKHTDQQYSTSLSICVSQLVSTIFLSHSQSVVVKGNSP